MRIRVSFAEEDAHAPSMPLALSNLMGGILQSLQLVNRTKDISPHELQKYHLRNSYGFSCLNEG